MIGVPALAYTVYARPEQGGTLTYLQVVAGYVIARVVIIAACSSRRYFKGELVTAYELLARRFGPATKHFAASLFVVMRAMADGVRVLRRLAGAGGHPRVQPPWPAAPLALVDHPAWACSR
ncbi:MAG: hypothetical protein MZV65_01195 [Chromatiales bacterium]|nr:hypothetical protein [Chromatiales bacterium]